MKTQNIKLVILLVLIVIIIALTWNPVTALTMGPCPASVNGITSECLDYQMEYVQVADNSPTFTQIDNDRLLVTYAPMIPGESVLLGSNLNKYRLDVYYVAGDLRTLQNPPVNEGQFFDSLALHLWLSCDQNGSAKPRVTFSIQKRYIELANGTMYHRLPRAMYIYIHNWEQTKQPCSY
jgi:hypothetical protein